jgi:hypothetical protein
MYGFNEKKSYFINLFASIGWTDPLPDFIKNIRFEDSQEAWKEMIRKIKNQH